jgi:F-type H+-transporting ATPase subunit alpha
MLKQGQYRPMPMQEQVVSIFSASPPEGRDSWVRGYEVSDLGRYEEEMLGYIRSRHADILEEIRDTAELPDELAAKLAAALDAFAEVFEPTKKAESEAA